MDSRLVTVFGGSGFVGRHTVRALARAGWRIRIATRHPNSGFFLRPLGAVGQIGFVKTDVADAEQVADAVAGAHAVINLTGILFAAGGQNFEDVHATGAENIAIAARAAGVESLVHVSAIGADSDSESAYARSKAAGEAAMRAHFADATILRPSIVFGPEDGFFNKFANLARFLPILPLVGGGKTRFQPIFVGDLASAVTAALDNAAARGRTYELGGPGVYSFRELLQMILHQTGRRRLLMPLPFGLAAIKALFLQFLPGTLLTPDQVKLLKTDNIVSPAALTLRDLGIAPTSLEAELPAYLWRYRAKGEFSGMQATP